MKMRDLSDKLDPKIIMTQEDLERRKNGSLYVLKMKKEAKRKEKTLIQDPIEKIVAEALDKAGIDYIHELKNPSQRLDFYLPGFDCYLECKAFSTNRTENQIKDLDVILVQGKIAAKAFSEIILKGLKQ